MAVQNVFIIMPFLEQSVSVKDGARKYSKEHLDDVYKILCEAVRSFRSTIVVDRMEQPYGNLVTAIINRLASADVVVAVLTGRNPNVFYELGIRHSLRLNTIMLVEQWDEYPFDLSSYFSQRYSIQHEQNREELKSFIKSRLEVYDSQTLPDSPVLETLRRSEIEQLKVLNAWETRRAALVIQGLVSEVIGIYGVFGECVEYLDSFQQGKGHKHRPHIELEWDVIDGFTKNRPLPGFPADAYADAESIYQKWRMFADVWNRYLDAKRKINPDDLAHVVAATDRMTTAFFHDLLKSWEYVMSRQVAFGIPWQHSMADCETLIPTTTTLDRVRGLLMKEAERVNETFKQFDKSFLGVPESLLIDALHESSTRKGGLSLMIAGQDKPKSGFTELVSNAEAHRRGGKAKRTGNRRKVKRKR